MVDDNGTHHPAKAVIANSNVPDLFGELIPREEIPGNYQKKLNSYRPSLSSFIVWLGLNRELKDIKDYEIFIGEDEGRRRCISRQSVRRSCQGRNGCRNL